MMVSVLGSQDRTALLVASMFLPKSVQNPADNIRGFLAPFHKGSRW